MGDYLLRVVYRDFVPTPPAVSIYDEICGITLMLHLDALFDTYELSLRLVAPVRSSYFLIFYSLIIHSFINKLRMSTNAMPYLPSA